MPWSPPFEDPIVLSDGRKLLTLKDAADYITKLPKKESDLTQWQVAIEALMLCSRAGDPMLARIAFMKALNRNVVRAFDPDAKKHHWGKRALKRKNRNIGIPPLRTEGGGAAGSTRNRWTLGKLKLCRHRK